MEVCSSTEMGAPGASHLGTGDHGPKTHRSRPRSVLVNGHPLGCVVAVGEKCTDSHPENSIVDVKPSYRKMARKARYFTVSNSSESETPNARAKRNRFLKEGFRRAVSIPPKYVRCIWANSARCSWDSPHSPSGCRVDRKSAVSGK